MTGAFQLESVLPWGRSRAEYAAFFDLGSTDAFRSGGLRLLDCGGGPSSFTVEMTRLGVRAVAADPLYRFTAEEIAGRVAEARRVMVEGLRAAHDRFVWRDYGSPEALEALRLATMRDFLEDYPEGLAAGRYVAAALPALPFADQAFDLVLSSHFLFLYDAQLGGDFHLAAIREMLRLGHELRIFPLLDLDGQASTLVPAAISRLEAEGFTALVQPVPYEFQKGGNEMLRVFPG